MTANNDIAILREILSKISNVDWEDRIAARLNLNLIQEMYTHLLGLTEEEDAVIQSRYTAEHLKNFKYKLPWL